MEYSNKSLLNQENAQRIADTMARLGAEYRARMIAGAQQAGEALSRMLARARDFEQRDVVVAGSQHLAPERETVMCDEGCGAYVQPRMLAEYKAALEHWMRHHESGGCSHGG